MSVTDIKKINVRSPFYISVSKDEEADVAITEPQVGIETLACGETVSGGTSVGTRKFNIDISDRVLGTFTVAISGVRTPIRYRLGYADNMPAAATIGWDDYQEAWTTATGETTGLVSQSSNPNGVSVNATYTTTQSDIDTYGTTLQLEIQQPLQTDGWSAALTCTARKNDADAVDGGFVTIITLAPKNNPKYFAQCLDKLYINGTLIGTISGNNIIRYVMSDVSPNLLPAGGYSVSDAKIQTNFYNSEQVGFVESHFRKTGGAIDVVQSYLAENILGSGTNEISITGSICKGGILPFSIRVARHPVEEISGQLYIVGNDDGVDIEALEVNATLYTEEYSPDNPPEFVMQFNGSNSVELAGINAFIEQASSEDGDFDQESGITEKVASIEIVKRTLKGI